MMPYSWRWSSLQVTGQPDFWHPTGWPPPRGLLEPCAATSGTHGSEGAGPAPRLPGGVTVPALAASCCESLEQGGKLCAFGGGQGCQETALLFVQDPHGRDLGGAAGVGRVD